METTREDHFIKLFISAYERGLWSEATLIRPDAINRTSAAVDQIAIRGSDGKRLAMEHTIIEPFVGEKQDFAFFDRAFLEIEQDKALAVPERWTRVFVPAGILRGQSKLAARIAIVDAVRSWLQRNRLLLPNGSSEHRLSVAVPGRKALDITLYIRVMPLPGPGALHIRRQQMANSLGDVIDKALRKKLPKLVNTMADKRILLLERQHMNLTPQHILREIEKRRASFPELSGVDQVWFIETILYGTAFGGTYVRFELYNGNEIVASFDFRDAKLIMKLEDGVEEVVRTVSDAPA